MQQLQSQTRTHCYLQIVLPGLYNDLETYIFRCLLIFFIINLLTQKIYTFLINEL